MSLIKDKSLALQFKCLHPPKAGHPLILTNIYDVLSARTVAPLPSCNALATTSYGIALATGVEDDNTIFEQNIKVARDISAIASELLTLFTCLLHG